jgi:hypothetical protein
MKEDQVKGLRAQLIDALTFSSLSIGSGVDMVEIPGAEDINSEVSTALKELPQGKLFATVLLVWRRLLPRDRYRIAATMLAEGDRGEGLAVFLHRRRKGLGSVTLWESDFSPPVEGGKASEASVNRLSLAAAAWAQFQILLDRNDDRIAKLGTFDWQSYAYFRLGVSQGERVEPVDTKWYFAKSVAVDPANKLASYNVAFWNMRLEEYDRAIERLEELKQRLEDAAGGRVPHPDILWYRVAYNLGAAQYHKALSSDCASAAPGLAPACDLVVSLLFALKLIDWELQPLLSFRKDQRLIYRQRLERRWEELTSIEGPAIVLLATTLLNSQRGEQTDACIERLGRKDLYGNSPHEQPHRVHHL